MGLNRLDRIGHRIGRVGRRAGCRSDDFSRSLSCLASVSDYRAQPLRSGRKEYGQRTGGACDGRGVGLAVGAAAGRGGGSDILSKRACCAVCTSAMSCLTCPRPLASSARLCRTAARPSDIASSFGSKFDDGATGAGAACEMDAIVSLEDCQTEPAAMPMQNVIGNAIASKICLSRDGSIIRSRLFFRPVGTFGSAGTRVASTEDSFGSAENHDRVELLRVELIGAFRLWLI